MLVFFSVKLLPVRSRGGYKFGTFWHIKPKIIIIKRHPLPPFGRFGINSYKRNHPYLLPILLIYLFDNFSFYNPIFQKIEISIYTSQNEYAWTIKNEFFERGLQKIQVDLSHNASGVYLIFVKLNDKFYVQKINFIK